MQEIDFAELKRQSKIAATMSVFASLVVLSALLISYLQLNRTQRQLSSVRSQIEKETKVRDTLKQGNEQLEVQKRQLQSQNDKLSNIVNAFTNSPAVSAATVETIAKAVSRPTRVASVPPLNNPQITIHIAPTRNRSEAEIAAKTLRESGFTVLGTVVETQENSTHDTTLRYFSYDPKSIKQAKAFVSLLTRIGFNIRPEYDEEYVDKPNAPALGTYELWIGRDPSYSGVVQAVAPAVLPPVQGQLSPTQKRLMDLAEGIHSELLMVKSLNEQWRSSVQYLSQQNFAEYRQKAMSGQATGVPMPRSLGEYAVKRLEEQNKAAISAYVNSLPSLIKNRDEAITLMNLSPDKLAEDSRTFAKANTQAQIPLSTDQVSIPFSSFTPFFEIENYLNNLVPKLYVH